MFKTPILCDRRIYDKKGKWHNPNEDVSDNIFYFIKEAPTLEPVYVNGREELKERLKIIVFGDKKIIKGDIITLANGVNMKVISQTINYVEHNILVVDKLKQRAISMEIYLE